MLSNTFHRLFFVEQIADLNIYANLKCGGFFLKPGILKELSKCTVVKILIWVGCLHNFQYLMFVKLDFGQSKMDKEQREMSRCFLPPFPRIGGKKFIIFLFLLFLKFLGFELL